ncbi:hypothetical protein ACFSLT_05155 [Novosphingobium resinovorum]
MAYARGLLSHYGQEMAFSAVHPLGCYGRVPHRAALDYLDELERRWSSREDGPRQRSLHSVLPQLAALLPMGKAAASQGVYVQASPHHLTNMAKVRRILQREQARFLCLVHDLIPIEFPEYARPSGAALHKRRMETVAMATAQGRGRPSSILPRRGVPCNPGWSPARRSTSRCWAPRHCRPQCRIPVMVAHTSSVLAR